MCVLIVGKASSITLCIDNPEWKLSLVYKHASAGIAYNLINPLIRELSTLSNSNYAVFYL